MIYPKNFEEKIGFKQIREYLKSNCLSKLGEELVDKMSFSSSHRYIERSLQETEEFMTILTEDSEFPTSYFYDVRESLNRIRVDGTILEVHELIELKRSLESIGAITRFFNDKEDKYPNLINKAGKVKVYPFIINRLEGIVSKHGTIKDTASVELGNIRRAIINKKSSISRRMQDLLQRAQKDGWAEQDSSISIRDGRMVIPVPSSHKRKIQGIVHDESATGKTSYIEPSEIVETNNDIKELEHNEKREIIKIILAFCSDLRPYIDDIIPSYNFLAFIDFVRSKAILSLKLEAIAPEFTKAPTCNIIRGFHPLLFLKHRQENKIIIPLDVEINDDNRIVLISGPNAGGKSVCLKTIGLIQYMFQSGMPVPVSEQSKLGIFSDIFIDIGDEQSLENDLSTYSSHLLNMKNFVKSSDKDSIVLIDEFGTGTEPMLGGAIAEAILHKLNKKKVRGVITTHYTNLKHYAESTEGIINGAMLYDSQNMKPLFELRLGKPGSSFAFEIAKKIGLPTDIIEDATDKIGKDHINFDKNLKDIARDKRYWENKRRKIHDNEKKLDRVLEKYDQELKETNALRKEIIQKAKQEAEDILKSANKSIENTIRVIKENNADKEKTRLERKKFAETKEQILKIENKEDERIQRKIRKLKEREEKRKFKRPKEEKENISIPEEKKEIAVGCNIRIKKSGNVGEVLELTNNTAVIALGNLRTTLPIKQIEWISKNQAKKEKPVVAKLNLDLQERVYKKKLQFKDRIDVRGMRANEALQTVMDFIDEAIMVDANEVRILHGTGTGILRQLIREFLNSVPSIRNFKDEKIQMGGAGITVVEFER